MIDKETGKEYFTEEEIYKVIPHSFVIAATRIDVIVKPVLIDKEGNCLYGRWNDVKKSIEIAQGLKEDGEVTLLDLNQIKNTFYHEMFHCFCFFSAFEQDESLVQTFANWMREFEESKQ